MIKERLKVGDVVYCSQFMLNNVFVGVEIEDLVSTFVAINETQAVCTELLDDQPCARVVDDDFFRTAIEAIQWELEAKRARIERLQEECQIVENVIKQNKHTP